MRNSEWFEANGEVLHKFGHEPGLTTVSVPAHSFPIEPWRVAYLMNLAFDRGYEQAQGDLRKALGIKQ